jgi:hypothetical protein
MEIKMMKCGCAGDATHNNDHDGLTRNHPCCLVHQCCEVVKTPTLEGRMARCSYYGRDVKTGSYDANCCDACQAGGICRCERPSSPKLWFFQYHADKPFDEFYCACQGAD